MSRTRTALKPILDPEMTAPSVISQDIHPVIHDENYGAKRLRPSVDNPKYQQILGLEPGSSHYRPLANAGPDGILDYLQSRGEKIKELEDELSMAKSSIKQLRTELAGKQTEVSCLRRELADQEQRQADRQILNEVMELEQLLKTQVSKTLELEKEAAVLREEKARIEAQKRESQAAREAERTTLEANCEKLRQQLQTLQSSTGRAKMELESHTAKLASELETERKRAESEAQLVGVLKRRLEEHASQHRSSSQELREIQRQLSVALAANKQLDMEVNSLKISSLVSARRASREAEASGDANAATLQDTLASTPASRTTRELVLPQVAKMAEEASTNEALLRSRIKALESQCKEWEKLYQVVPSCSSPTLALQIVSERLQENARSAQVISELHQQIERLGSSRGVAEKERDDARQTAAAAQQKINELKTQLLFAGKELELVKQERDALRHTLDAPPAIDKLDTISGRLLLGQARTRAFESEHLVASLSKQVLELQKAAASSPDTKSSSSSGSMAAAVARAEVAETRVAQLEKEADRLGHQVAVLQEKLGSGGFNAPSTRVLHFKHNPEAVHQKALSAGRMVELECQVAALKETIARLEAGAGQSRGNAAHATATAEVQVAETRMAQAEKQLARLKQVFRERTTVFREACYQLFGYRVDMTSEATAASSTQGAPTTFVLRPQHGDEPDAALVFQVTEKGGMELVPNNYTKLRLARETDTFIHKFHCIPAFTANLTMELFQKATQC